MTDSGKALVEELVAAVEARPDEARSFLIPPFNGTVQFVIHKGLPGGRMQTSAGVIDELIQSGQIVRTEGHLHELTARAYERRRAATVVGRVATAGREMWKLVVAAAGVIVALVAVLTWLGVRP